MPEDEHDKFIAEAIEKPGYLHRALGIPEGERIPRSRIEEATQSENKHTARAARLALTLEKLRKRRETGNPVGTIRVGEDKVYKRFHISHGLDDKFRVQKVDVPKFGEPRKTNFGTFDSVNAAESAIDQMVEEGIGAE